LTLLKRIESLVKASGVSIERHSRDIEQTMFGDDDYLETHAFTTSHQFVNVYGKPEKRYEVRSEDAAVDVQISDHEYHPKD